MARSRFGSPNNAAPLSVLIAHAAASGHARTNGVDLKAAVTELARIAQLSVLENGVLASDVVRAKVDAVASRYLNRAAADRALTRTLQRIGDQRLRSAIEVAHDQVLEPSELAHYYAGLMAGLALIERGRSRF